MQHEYKEIKVSELSGAALDWSVARCEYAQGFVKYGVPCFNSNTKRVYKTEGLRQIGVDFSPSTSWDQGGSIIEREEIHLLRLHDNNTAEWVASIAYNSKGGKQMIGCRVLASSQTPLIAAMRCYVASKLGDSVDIPVDLIE